MGQFVTVSLIAFVTCGALFAQTLDASHALADKMVSAFNAGRYDEASLWANPDLLRLVSAEQVATLTPAQAFSAMDAAQASRTAPFENYLHLPNLAKAAYAAGQIVKAEQYAREALDGATRFGPNNRRRFTTATRFLAECCCKKGIGPAQ